MRFALPLSLFLIAVPPRPPADVQRDDARIEIVLNQSALGDGPAITASRLLSNPNTKDLLVNGAFPTAIRFRLQLWRKGGWWSDDLSGRFDWDILVRYDPTKQVFNLVRRQNDRDIEDFGSLPNLDAVESQLARPFKVPLRPVGGGRYYYNLNVEVQALTETDLDALQHWLRGTKAQGSSNPVSWLARGVRSLFARALDGDKRHYVVQSGVFRI